MRSEVKLGYAIGGVILAVVVVWVLAVGGSNKPKLQAGGEERRPGAPESLAQRPADAPRAGAETANANLPNAHPAQTDASAGQDASQPAPADAAASGQQARNNGGDLDWGKLLNSDQPMLIAQTPSPSGTSAQTPARNASTPPQGSAADSAAADRGQAPAATPPGATPPPAQDNPQLAAAPGAIPGPHDSTALPAAPGAIASPAPGATAASGAVGAAADSGASTAGPASRPAGAVRTHVVQKGETLSSIAAAAYGSANFYPHILRANPNLKPEKMRPGITITLPDVADVRPQDVPGGAVSGQSAATPSAAPAHSASKLDSTKEYKVQAGDSLYRISIKLYGKSELKDKIYELNKGAIGADPAKLKLGMVLKLPQPPTAAAH